MNQFTYQETMSHLCTEGVRLMGLIEDKALNGKMFHEVYPDIERDFWAANDSRDIKALQREYRKLCNLHDSLTMD